uniref:Uncharacterized protein n=1 Tax=Ciona intestinalis TaxID=7719 RepID=H2XMR4_CIOIN
MHMERSIVGITFAHFIKLEQSIETYYNRVVFGNPTSSNR